MELVLMMAPPGRTTAAHYPEVEHCVEVGPHHPVPFLRRDLLDAGDAGRVGTMVDEDTEPYELGYRAFDQFLAVRILADIPRDETRSARLLDLGQTHGLPFPYLR